MRDLRVLLVDDDPALLAALPGLVGLRMPGVRMETCDCGQAALARLEAVDYDAVVCDIKMPEMDGLALLDEVKRRRPDTPTLLVTGHGEHTLAVRALRGGAYDFVQKPIDRDYFVASLTRALQMRGLRRKVQRQQAELARRAVVLERLVRARTRALRAANETRDRSLARERAIRAEAETAERRAAFLARASRLLAASLDYEATLARMARLAVPVLADWCIVDLLEADRSVRRLAAAHADPATGEPAEEGGRHPASCAGASREVVTVLATGRSMLVAEMPAEPCAGGTGAGAPRSICEMLQARSCVCVPLVARTRTVGALTFLAVEPGRRFGRRDLRLAEDLARRAALAVDNARLCREAQAAVRARDEFLARASHELRTPLTSALGTIRLLRKAMIEGTPGEQPEVLVEIASRNLGAMAALVNDLLDASKLAAGRETLVLEPVEVADIVAASLEVVTAQASEKGTSVSVAVPSDLWLAADRLKLEQALVNLLANAVRFTPAGGEIAVEAGADGGDVVLRVRDTGEGIRPEHLEAVFEPFFQAGQGRRHARGTGLGLAICRQIVTLHGGAIWAESQGPGTGSTFTMRLPAFPARRVSRPAA